MYSVLFCASASGGFLPPFIVFKDAHLYSSWTTGGPEGTLYGCTKSGWMEDSVFESWFIHFAKYVENMKKPALLLFDGHASHLTYQTVKCVMENKIIILCLPPNTSHALQPLDVGVFAPFKAKWKEILKHWFRETRLKTVDKAVFPALVKKLFLNMSGKNAVKGFSGSGLVPVNKEVVHQRIVSTEFIQNKTHIIANTPLVITDAQHSSKIHMPATDSTNIDQNKIPQPQFESPYKDLKQAIINVISPPLSQLTQEALKNSKSKRKRVQAKEGEVLTSPEVAKRLQLEEIERIKILKFSKKERSVF